MNYELLFMEGFRKWPYVPGNAGALVQRYFPGTQLITTSGGGGGATQSIRDLQPGNIPYKCFMFQNSGNYGNGNIQIRNVTVSPPGTNRRFYAGFRYCSNGTTPQNVGWIYVRVVGSTNMTDMNFPGLPASTGSWYFEVVLDRVKKKLTAYRNGVAITSMDCLGENAAIALINIGNAADSNPFYGKSWGVTDIYFARDMVKEGTEEDHNVHGPVIIEDVTVDAFSAPGWQPSDSNMTPVDIYNLATTTGSPNEKIVNSPFDGTPGIATFSSVQDGDIRGVMVSIRHKRGTSSTGKLKMEVGNENFSKKMPDVIAIPPYTESTYVGHSYVTMAKDFNNLQWTSDSIKGIRLRITSIAEMSK